MSALLAKAKKQRSEEAKAKKAKEAEEAEHSRKKEAQRARIEKKVFAYVVENLDGAKVRDGKLKVEVANNHCRVLLVKKGYDDQWQLTLSYGGWSYEGYNEGQGTVHEEGFIVEYLNLNYNYRKESSWYPSTQRNLESRWEWYEWDHEKNMKRLEEFLVDFLKQRI